MLTYKIAEISITFSKISIFDRKIRKKNKSVYNFKQFGAVAFGLVSNFSLFALLFFHSLFTFFCLLVLFFSLTDLAKIGGFFIYLTINCCISYCNLEISWIAELGFKTISFYDCSRFFLPNFTSRVKLAYVFLWKIEPFQFFTYSAIVKISWISRFSASSSKLQFFAKIVYFSVLEKSSVFQVTWISWRKERPWILQKRVHFLEQGEKVNLMSNVEK